MASKKNKPKKEVQEKVPQVEVDTAKLLREYDEAVAELDNRIQNKKFGFDTYDRLYQVYIDPAKWPYSVTLPTPRGFSTLYGKGVRMVGGRFTGVVRGQEQGDETGAKIATEHFKWSVERFNQFSDQSIEAKLFQYDQNTRTYGAGFARVYWKTVYRDVKNDDGHTERIKVYDNWWIDILNNRDLLLQPGRETIGACDYVTMRRFASLDELDHLQEDGAGFDDKAMSVLREQKEGKGRQSGLQSPVKTMKGLTEDGDTRFEVCTTYYRNKWVTWCPRQGGKKHGALVLRSIQNPYKHQDIPIVPLVYIPSQEDIYGMSELQPVSALLKILSALQSQFVELVNRELYPPIIVNPNEARIDTFKYVPKAFWIANNPDAIKQFEGSQSSLAKFEQVYKLIVTEFVEAMGETGQGISSMDMLGTGDKTATEVRDQAGLRNSRDNFNKIMLRASLRKIMYLIFEMLRDSNFVDPVKVIKIVGRDALEYFDKSGMGDWHIDDEGYQKVVEYAQILENEKDPAIKGEMQTEADKRGLGIFDLAYELLLGAGELEEFMIPNSPVTTANGTESKYERSSGDDDTGYLKVELSKDYLGDYDFIPDVDALNVNNNESQFKAKVGWYQLLSQADQSGALARDGVKIKYKELLTKIGELSEVRDAEQYFDVLEQPMGGDANGIVQGGGEMPGAGGVGQGLPGGGAVQPIPQAGPIGQAPTGLS